MKVLIATDGSEPALRACRWFRDLTGGGRAEVRVLTVLSYDMYPHALVAGEHLSNEAEMEAAVEAKVHGTTRAPRELLSGAGFKVSEAHRFGNPGDEILAEIDEWHPDLVVIGKRGVRGVARLIGSVSEHVIHRCKCPILVVP